MTVKELIDLLLKCNPDAIVKAYDEYLQCPEEITGIIFDKYEVEIQTDDTNS